MFSCPLSSCDAASVPATEHIQAQAHHLERPSSAVACTLASEVPVALVFNGISHAVMMASPGDAAELALGFALTEGILDSADDCYDIEVQTIDAAQARLPPGIHGVQVQLQIAARCFMRLKDRRRSMSGRTGCGVCGVESFAALDLDCPPLPAHPWLAQVDVHTVLRAMDALRDRQALHQATRATHAAAWVDLQGHILHVMEDVGRHNALDKLVGCLAQRKQLQQPGFALLSSRGSHELVRKCARVGIAALATASAPTAMGVRMAELTGLRLWGLCRSPQALLYTPGSGQAPEMGNVAPDSAMGASS